MNRGMTVLCAATALALACAAPAAQPDPTKAKLDKLRAAYETELSAAEKSIGAQLDRAEAAARKAGDKKALDRIKGERELFELANVFPKSLPGGTTQKLSAAHKALDTALAGAVKEYTKANRDAEAEAAEKELAALKGAAGLRPRYFLVVNKNSELVLAAAKEKGDPGSGVLQAKRTGADNQLWALVPPSPDAANVFLLRNKASGLYASLGGGRNPGDNLFLDKGTENTCRWTLERDGFHFLFRNEHSKLYMTIPEASKEVGVRVFQWTKETTFDHYRWNLVAAK